MLETSKGLTAITKNALAMTLEPYVPLGKPPAQAQAHPMDVINVPEYYDPKIGGARSKERRGGAMVMRCENNWQKASEDEMTLTHRATY